MPIDNVIDLFAGVGGLSLGAARAGFKIRCAVELDPHAIESHKNNFPETVHLAEDVRTLTGEFLYQKSGILHGELAGIIGGPPCQGFSFMGRRKKSDSRNQLFAEFFRIVSEMSPAFFLAENVPGILRDENADIINNATSILNGRYTILPPVTLSANDYGAPTTRKRVFFFGYLPGTMVPMTQAVFTPPLSKEVVRVKDALLGLPNEIPAKSKTEEDTWKKVFINQTGFFHSRLHGRIPDGIGNAHAIKLLKERNLVSGFIGTVHSKEVAARYLKIAPGQVDAISKSKRLELDGFCPTLRAGTGSDHGSFQAVRPLHPTENRVITPREAARLQGFPDWFLFSPTKWHSFRQIGNSVSPILAEKIFLRIKSVFVKENPCTKISM